ncbi:efflux transporter outer membrane subunit [Burkholderia cepacia]|uniref:efflux transporter outer membrane subunit n=1 Tax=Burkholderia cepacia TaxID=292 RepID=UPI002AB6F7D8|nr:efflux transporter outer membrane subunit [Burkholderia cepacia]
MLFRPSLHKRIALPLLASLSAALGGCVVGPNFQRPVPPAVSSYMPTADIPMSPDNGISIQQLKPGAVVPSEWWRMFRSPELNKLVQKAQRANPNIEAALHTLAQAKQELREVGGTYMPQVDGGADARRQNGPPFALGIRPDHTLPTYGLYTVGATVSFTPDVFGLTARRVERQAAQVENRRYQMAALQLSVTGNVVDQALKLAAAKQQIAIAADMVETDELILSLARQLEASGKVSTTSIWLAQEQLDTDRATIPPLRNQTATAVIALATLVGQPPAAWKATSLTLDALTLPTELPVSMPSQLVRQRPDILAAEARLHAASASVGVADAEMYPQFTLSASTGTAALAVQALGSGSSVVWTLISGLTAPIFRGGTLAAQRQAAINHFDSELALYRASVLQGLEQVAGVLQAIRTDEQLASATQGAWKATQAQQQLEWQRYRSGKVSLLEWLKSSRNTQRAHLAYVQTAVRRYHDSADLMVALGGYWPLNEELGSCPSEARERPVPGCLLPDQPQSP